MSEDITLEDLQTQLLESKAQIESLQRESEAFKAENDSLKASLNKARDLNMSLFERVPVSTVRTDPIPDEEDSFERLIDETIDKLKKR